MKHPEIRKWLQNNGVNVFVAKSHIGSTKVCVNVAAEDTQKTKDLLEEKGLTYLQESGNEDCVSGEKFTRFKNVH